MYYNQTVKCWKKVKVDDSIRSSDCDIVISDEVQHLINDGIIKEFDDIYEMQKDAATILPHICNTRCKKRVTSNGNVEDFQCRKTNTLRMSPDNTKSNFQTSILLNA